MFINPGGPGGSGVDYVGFFESKGLERYDIVGWDPRGVGKSTPVTCFNKTELDGYLGRDSSPDSTAEDEELLGGGAGFRPFLPRTVRSRCWLTSRPPKRSVILMCSGPSSATTKLNYFGSSYGTQIGALYAQLFPKLTGRLVLDGAVNITEDKSISQTLGFERALGSFAAWCAQQKCKLGDSKQQVLDRISAFWADLDAEPLQGRAAAA